MAEMVTKHKFSNKQALNAVLKSKGQSFGYKIMIDTYLIDMYANCAVFLQVIHQTICGSRLIAPFRRYMYSILVFDVIILVTPSLFRCWFTVSNQS